jgi:hypothetical protein
MIPPVYASIASAVAYLWICPVCKGRLIIMRSRNGDGGFKVEGYCQHAQLPPRMDGNNVIVNYLEVDDEIGGIQPNIRTPKLS